MKFLAGDEEDIGNFITSWHFSH